MIEKNPQGLADRVREILDAGKEDLVSRQNSSDTPEKRREKTRLLLQQLKAKGPSIQPGPIEEDEEELKRRLEAELAGPQ